MLTPDHIEMLERYHKGQLSETEKQEVKNSILTNPELKAEAEAVLELLQGFNAIRLENFQNEMMGWEKKHVNVPLNNSNTEPKEVKMFSMKTFITKYRFAAAAVVLVLMLPLGFLLFQNMNVNPAEKLFASNADHYTALVLGTRTGNNGGNGNVDPLESLKEQGIASYNEQKYSDALKQLNEYFSKVDEEKKTTELKLYLGLSNLFTGNTADAKTFFQSIIQEGTADNYKEAAEWYLALTYLKEMNATKSAELLQTISQVENHPYQSKAATLLPEVKTLKQ